MIRCPNCQELLPDPPESFCSHCGAALGMAPAALRAPSGGIPWEERGARGFFAAFLDTSKEVLSGPTRFFRRMPVAGGIGAPLLYGVLAAYVGLLAGLLYGAFYGSALQGLVAGQLASLGYGGEGGSYLGLLMGTAGTIVQAVLGPINLVVRCFFHAAVLHGVLMLLGGARSGFEATLRVVCYSQAAELLGLLPFCGSLAALAWLFVLYVIGLSEAHGISRGKAVVAVLVPILLACCCCALGLGVAFGGIAALLGQLQAR